MNMVDLVGIENAQVCNHPHIHGSSVHPTLNSTADKVVSLIFIFQR